MALGHKGGGRTIQGLVNRRNAERQLIFHGDYGDGVGEGVQRTETKIVPKTPDPVVKEAQELLTAKGLNHGAIDGWMGKKTKAALLEYQKAHPNLDKDGILGPATLAQLRRDAAAEEPVQTGGGSVAGSGALTWASGFPWQWVLAGTHVDAFEFSKGRLRVIHTNVPSSASDTGEAGQIARDGNYIYVCVATDTWKRVTISTW